MTFFCIPYSHKHTHTFIFNRFSSRNFHSIFSHLSIFTHKHTHSQADHRFFLDFFFQNFYSSQIQTGFLSLCASSLQNCSQIVYVLSASPYMIVFIFLYLCCAVFIISHTQYIFVYAILCTELHSALSHFMMILLVKNIV